MGIFDRKKKTANAASTTEETIAPPVMEDGVVDVPGIEEEPKTEELRQTGTTATQDIVYPHGFKLFFLLLSAFASMFLVSLVSSLPAILATAVQLLALVS
jgi:hypothetical protein